MSQELVNAVRELGESYDSHVAKMNLRIDELAAKQSKPNLPNTGGGSAMAEIAKSISAGRADLERYGTLRFDVEGSVSKAVYSTNTSQPLSGGAIMVGARPGEPFRLRSLLPSIKVDSGSAWSIAETALTGNVAQRSAEGDAFGASTINIGGQIVQLVSFGAYATLSEEALADIDKLQAYLERTMSYALSAKVEAYLLSTLAANATTHNANYFSITVCSNNLDQVASAAAQQLALGFGADVLAINPGQGLKFRMLKANSGGDYLYGSPDAAPSGTIFGRQVAECGSLGANNFAVIDSGRTLIYERGAASIELGRINDDFAKGLLRLRITERLAIVKAANGAVMTGAFTAAS